MQVVILLGQEVGGIGHGVKLFVVGIGLRCRLVPELVHASYSFVILFVCRLHLELCPGKSDTVLSRLYHDRIILFGKLVHVLLVRLCLGILFPSLGVGPERSGTALDGTILHVDKVGEFRYQLA